MMMAYVAGAAGLTVLAAGQQGGAAMLDRALQGDAASLEQVLGQAERVVGSGIDFGTAALIIAFVPVCLRLLQMATPFTETLNLIWRKKALGPHEPPAL